ncbi:hypothetical protein ASD78_00940 [Lysobacter sp. Root667]|nr:hypothetical protein ASD78_00940 [Lysobacter sp. Root667]
MAALAGAWAAFCLLLPRLGYALLDEPVRTHMLEITDTLGLVMAKYFSLSGLPPWPLQAMLVFIVAALAALVWLLVLHWLDRDKSARQALRWSLRTFPMLLLWCAGLGLITGATVLAHEHLGSYAVWSIALLLIYFLSLPFFFLRREPIASDRPPLAWLPSWPGWPVVSVVGACVLLMSATAMLEAGLESGPSMVELIAAAVVWVLQSIALATVVLLWLRRPRWNRLTADVRDSWRWFRLRRVFAVRWRLYGLFVLTVFPLLFAIALDTIFFQPELARTLDMRQLARPLALVRWVEVSDWVMQWWWPGLGLTMLWLDLTACARTLLQVDNAGPP